MLFQNETYYGPLPEKCLVRKFLKKKHHRLTQVNKELHLRSSEKSVVKKNL